MLWNVDESGKDYLYPKDCCVAVKTSPGRGPSRVKRCAVIFLSFTLFRYLELYAAFVVRLRGSGQIEFGERDLLCCLFTQHP